MTIMYFPNGIDELDVHPTNVDNMLRKGFTLEPTKEKRPSKKKAEVTTEADDSNLQVTEEV